ncbi:hypothetical protein CBS14141_004389 [Malassezia furfur]|nr:hypothetical protein CBS14141_004389 [Malassezia furfur]
MSTEAPVDLRDLSDALEESDAPHTDAPRTDAPHTDADERATERATEPHAAQLEQLVGMFPDTPRATLQQLLVQHHGNLDAAIPAALEVSDPDFTPTAADLAVQQHASQPGAGQGPFPVAHAYPPPVPPRPTVPTQQWDPTQLRYSPRLAASDAAQPPVPPRPAAYAARPHAYGAAVPMGEQPLGDGKKLQEDLKRMTETGIAKVSSTFSTLRQKAQHAMRNLEQEGRLRTPRDAPAPRTSRVWTTAPPTWGAAYDQDPEPVHDTELDRLVHGDTTSVAGATALTGRRRPSAQAPRWGQRYAQATPSAAMSTAQATRTQLSWADVGVDEDDEPVAPKKGGARVSKADAVKEDAERQMQAKVAQPADDVAAGLTSKGRPVTETVAKGVVPTRETGRRTQRAQPPRPRSGACGTGRGARGEAPATAASASAAPATAASASAAPATAASASATPAGAPDALRSPAVAADPATDTDDDDYVHNPFDDDD